MRAGITLSLNTPVFGGKETGRTENNERMNEQSEQGKLDFARTDLLTKIFRCAADHLAHNEDPDNHVQQHIDHADALAAEDAVDPHAKKRRYGGDGIQAVVLA